MGKPTKTRAARSKKGQLTKEAFAQMTPEEQLLEVARANIALYGTITPPVEAQLLVQRNTCPKCGHEGPAMKDFGMRTVRGKKTAQSWCRTCRNSNDSHPTRFGMK